MLLEGVMETFLVTYQELFEKSRVKVQGSGVLWQALASNLHFSTSKPRTYHFISKNSNQRAYNDLIYCNLCKKENKLIPTITRKGNRIKINVRHLVRESCLEIQQGT